MRVKSKIFYWYAAFVIAYACLTLFPAPDPVTLSHYHLHPASLRGLELTIILPLALIWFAAFYGYSRLWEYGQMIRKGRDGRPVLQLAYGVLVLALGLPLSSILSQILTLVARHHHAFTAGAVVISNYVNALYPLIAFIFISVGAWGLSEISKARLSLRQWNILAFIAIAIGVVFCALIVQDHQQVRQTFHMGASVTIVTLALPYIYTWCLGIFAAMQIYLYSRNVTGVLYRRSWNTLAVGLGSIIIVDIILQYLGTLSTWLTGLSLSRLLVLLYVLLLLLASAYIVVALGTKKLRRIEEV